MNHCEHDNTAPSVRVCRHLLYPDVQYLDYIRWYTGDGMGCELLCEACTKRREGGDPAELWALCEGCHSHILEDVGTEGGIRGTPEIQVKDEPFDTMRSVFEIPDAVGAVLDFVPIEKADVSSWLLLGEGGVIWRYDADTKDLVRLAIAQVIDEPNHKAWHDQKLRLGLYVSSCGRFAAVVAHAGRYGCVVDLESGQTTMPLDGGDYCSNTVPFSLAFARRDNRPILIHRTAWNRLDFSDPETGELLSAREPTSYQRGEERPEHYLDYFHGALHVSPGGDWIADDGWVWHPVGDPSAWKLKDWLSQNVWESEDGQSKRYFCHADYYWNRPMAWIDERRLVVGGIGRDDDWMVAGAQVVEMRHDKGGNGTVVTNAFAGPSGRFFSDGTWLYASGEDGLSRWDVVSGVRTALVPGFSPTAFCRASAEFAMMEGMQLHRLKFIAD